MFSHKKKIPYFTSLNNNDSKHCVLANNVQAQNFSSFAI